jgi:WD40 repeat protein
MSPTDRTTPEPTTPDPTAPDPTTLRPGPTAHGRPLTGTSRERFVTELAARRAASGKSFAVLARELDHPRSTIHGWCRGDHLPFPRDDDVFDRLLRSIGVDDPEPWLATLRQLRSRGDRQNPYRGLEPYTEGDTTRFHGRDALIDRLVAALDDGRASTAHPLIVIGASGSGKTSLLRAGLIGRLRGRPDHVTATITPGHDPSQRLERAVSSVTGARAATIVIDQFEELFTLAPESEIDPTIAAITAATRAGISVAIGVRADFFHHVAEIPYLLDALDQRQVVVGPMSTQELTEAIVAPATEAGYALTPSLVAHLLREFDEQTQRARGTHALPLLSHVLFRLVERATGDTIGLTDYQAIGGLRDSLQQSADEALATLPGELHEVCRQLFLQLVELGSGATPTRRSADRSVLTGLATADTVTDVLDVFVTRRLLTIEQDAVTLSHEALLTAWPTLRDWVDGERSHLLVRRRVRSAHRLWRESGTPVDGLLRGSLLDEATALLGGPLRSTLDDAEREFVRTSHREREAARARDAAVLSRQIAAQSDLLGARDPSLSGHLALEAAEVADTVESRSAILRCCASGTGPRFVGPTGPSAVATAPLTGRAVAAFCATGRIERYELTGDVPQPAAGAVESQPRVHAIALDAGGDVLATGTRDGRVTVVDATGVTDLAGVEFRGPVYTVAVSPAGDRVVAAGSPPGIASWRRRDDAGGGTWELDSVVERDDTTMGIAVRWTDGTIATASSDGTVSLWSPDGTPRWTADVPTTRPVASSVALSPDGGTLAAGYHDGTVRVWKLGDRPTEHALGSAAFATWVNGVDFSPDGALLAAASSDGTVRLWDTGTWREHRVELRHPSVVSGVRFLADRWLVTSSEDGIVRTWDVAAAITGSDASIWSVRFDATGSTMVTASRRQLSIARRTERGWTHHGVPAPEDLQFFSGVCDITADASLIAAGTRSGSVLLVDGHTGVPIMPLHGQLGPLVEGVLVLDDVVVAVDSGGRIHRWSLGSTDAGVAVTGSTGCSISTGTALGVADFGDGLVGVATEPGELVVADITGDEMSGDDITVRARFHTGEAFPICAARRPGHRTIVTAGADRAVSVWSVEEWDRPELVERLVGPAGHVMTVAVDRSGTHLAAGTTDGRIWIWTWDVAGALHPWATIETGEAGVYAVCFSPDGTHLVSAGPNERVTWWPLDVSEAIDTVRGRIGDALTDQERARLMPSRI